MPALHLEKELEAVLYCVSIPRAMLELPTAAENVIAGDLFKATDVDRAAYSWRIRTRS